MKKSSVPLKFRLCLRPIKSWLFFNQKKELLVVEKIQKGFKIEAIFFRCLYFTGMRFNEGLGVHPGNLYEGQIEDRMLNKHLIQESISYFGYLVIDSQPSHKTRGLRDQNGIIHRKPLKGRKRIDEKSARTIVITDKALWNDLVELHNTALNLYENKVFSLNIDQYPLFEGIDKGTSSVRLKSAYEDYGFSYRSWHCCRHTRATFLIGQTGNSILGQ
jgi:hypothetical protein